MERRRIGIILIIVIILFVGFELLIGALTNWKNIWKVPEFMTPSTFSDLYGSNE